MTGATLNIEVLPQVYRPVDGEILYHYCSAATMLAILQTGSLRFTDINMMNDPSEVRFGYRIFEEAATRMLEHSKELPADAATPKQFFDDVDAILHHSQLGAHPFLACFSREKNSLDQWRAYGDDGHGFAIGFDAKKLSLMPVTLLNVVYELEMQVKLMMAHLLGIWSTSYKKRDNDDSQFRHDCSMLGVLLAAYKHRAFASESEVRALHAVKPELTAGGKIRFVDEESVTRGNVTVPPQPVQFGIRGGHLTAYLDLPLRDEQGSPIAELVVGPKNVSHPGNVAAFLGTVGLDNVVVYRSSIPYL